MARNPGSVEIGRRKLCASAGGALLALGLSACTSRQGGELDLAGDDLAGLDLTNGGCGSNGLSAGPASAIVMNQAVAVMDTQHNEYFVCRDGSGLYGLSATCPHQCCDVNFDAADQQFVCPCHGSTFAYDGTNTFGPANGTPLKKLSVCIDHQGNAIVDLQTPYKCMPTPGE